MIHNIGITDRALRAFIVAPAAVVVALVVLGAGTVGAVILFVVAGIALVTAVAGFCPTYTLVGISTLPHVHRVEHYHPHLRRGHA